MPTPGGERDDAAPARLDFEALYEAHFHYVWRSLRRLGVPAGLLEDATQDTFLVVHRRLDDFEGRSSVRTWLFAIAILVARSHRRRLARKGRTEPLVGEVPSPLAGPVELVEKRRAAEFLDEFLATLDDDRRAVFVLAELEQMTAPEIQDALGVKLNTVYSRLRSARQAFEAAVARHQARERSRT